MIESLENLKKDIEKRALAAKNQRESQLMKVEEDFGSNEIGLKVNEEVKNDQLDYHAKARQEAARRAEERWKASKMVQDENSLQ